MTEPHTFLLANGDSISVRIAESGYGVEGFQLKITADRGNLIIRPNSDNSITVTTSRAIEAEKTALEATVRERQQKKKQIAGASSPQTSAQRPS